MVDWESLDETERDKDREPIQEVPAMLAYAGFEIVRMSELGDPARAVARRGPGDQAGSPRSNAPLTPASSALHR